MELHLPEGVQIVKPRDIDARIIGWRRFHEYQNVRLAKDVTERLQGEEAGPELIDLRALGTKIALRDRDDLCQMADSGVSDIMALDIPDPGLRLLFAANTVIADAERFADAYADFVEAKSQIIRLTKQIRELLGKLEGRTEELQALLLDHFLLDLHPEDKSRRREEITLALRKLSALVIDGDHYGRPRVVRPISDEEIKKWYAVEIVPHIGLLTEYPTQESFATAVRAGKIEWLNRWQEFEKNLSGRPRDEPRHFLLLRLAEVFAFSSGVEPSYRVSPDYRSAAAVLDGELPQGSGANQTLWHKFLTMVLEIMNFPHRGMLDGISTDLAGLDRGLRDISEEARQIIRRLAGKESSTNPIATVLDLPSAHLQAGYGIPRWPGDDRYEHRYPGIGEPSGSLFHHR